MYVGLSPSTEGTQAPKPSRPSPLNASTSVTLMLVCYRGLESANAEADGHFLEGGLFYRLHLGLHMAQQTAVRQAGGHMGEDTSSGFALVSTLR